MSEGRAGSPAQRVELCSPRWIEAAGRIAAELVASGEFPDARVTVCEVFHHPPPSVGGGADVFAWTLTITPEGARAEVGDTPGTDVRLEAEYAQALLGAREVRPADVGPPPERGPAAKLTQDTRKLFRRLHNQLAEMTL